MACAAAVAIAMLTAGGSAAESSSQTNLDGASAARSSAALSSNASGTVRVSTRKLAGLGSVLVDSRGRTLYMFVPDKSKRVTCVAACAAIWPPLKLAKSQKPAASGGAKQKLLGSDPDPTGGRVVTYARWPLYTYVADTRSGVANGQALNLNGGLWYVLSPTGKVIRKKP